MTCPNRDDRDHSGSVSESTQEDMDFLYIRFHAVCLFRLIPVRFDFNRTLAYHPEYRKSSPMPRLCMGVLNVYA